MKAHHSTASRSSSAPSSRPAFEDRFIAIGLNYRVVGGFRFYERAGDPRRARLSAPHRATGRRSRLRTHLSTPPSAGWATRPSNASTAPRERRQRALVPPRAGRYRRIVRPRRATLSPFCRDFARWRDAASTIARRTAARGAGGRLHQPCRPKSRSRPGPARNLSNWPARWRNTRPSALPRTRQPGDGQRGEGRYREGHHHDHPRRQGAGIRPPLPARLGGRGLPQPARFDAGGLAALEEERRLAYVAITRARRCTIVHAASRRIYGQWTSSIPSRFIASARRTRGLRQHARRGPACGAHSGARPPTPPTSTANAPNAPRTAAPAGTAPPPPSIPPRAAWSDPPHSAASFAAKPRSDISPGARVFHEKFGSHRRRAQEGNKLE